MDDKKKKKKLRVKKKETRSDPEKESQGKDSSRRNRKKETVDLNPKASQKRIHQILPLVFGLLAFLIFVTLLLNLLCNAGNHLTFPKSHWMGVFGYYVSYGLLGMFGQMAFLIPLLLLNSALLWRRWSQRGVQGWKSFLSVLLFLFSDALLHVIFIGTSSVTPGPGSDPAMLIEYGNKYYAGGFLGGELGYWMLRLMRLISPLIMLNSWGSSSSFSRRITRPAPVTRSSFFAVHPPVLSAFTTMLRNLKIRNGWLWYPPLTAR